MFQGRKRRIIALGPQLLGGGNGDNADHPAAFGELLEKAQAACKDEVEACKHSFTGVLARNILEAAKQKFQDAIYDL